MPPGAAAASAPCRRVAEREIDRAAAGVVYTTLERDGAEARPAADPGADAPAQVGQRHVVALRPDVAGAGAQREPEATPVVARGDGGGEHLLAPQLLARASGQEHRPA